MNPLDRARKWFRLNRRISKKREPILWMEAEEECAECPFRCPDCDAELIAFHDSWHCDFCGLVW